MKNKNILRLSPLGRVLFCALFHAPVAAASASSPSIDETRLLSAIAAVETGAGSLAQPCKKIGRRGERGPWQFTKSTWKRYTQAAFELASQNASMAHLIASLHLRYLRTEIELR